MKAPTGVIQSRHENRLKLSLPTKLLIGVTQVGHVSVTQPDLVDHEVEVQEGPESCTGNCVEQYAILMHNV